MARKPKAQPAPVVAAAQTVNLSLLKMVIDNTNASDAGFAYVAEFDYTPLLNAGLVEVNKAIVSQTGEHAVRATDAGKAAYADSLSSASTAVAATAPVKQEAPKMTFEIETDIAMPAIQRRGSGESVYPFAQMNVGASFHIPATAEDPEPWKSKGSAISSATKRMSPKVFAIRKVDANDPKGVGARVWRKPDMTHDEQVALEAKRLARKATAAAE